jgi:hypothetical protein
LNFRLQEDTFSFQQIQLLVEKKEFSKVAAAFSRFPAGLRIRIRIGSGFSRVSGSGSSFSFQQIQLMVEKKELSKVAAAFSPFWQGCGSGSEVDPDSVGSVDPDPSSPSSRSSSWSRRRS